MSKQTAVEWLMQTLEQNNIIDLDVTDSDKYYTIIEQAKEMEKKEIVDAHYQGYRNFIDTTEISEQYYNETYGKETDRS